jgi:hypothetical protein
MFGPRGDKPLPGELHEILVPAPFHAVGRPMGATRVHRACCVGYLIAFPRSTPAFFSFPFDRKRPRRWLSYAGAMN